MTTIPDYKYPLDFGYDVIITSQEMMLTFSGAHSEFKGKREMYRYLHRCIRAVIRFSEWKPFGKNKRIGQEDVKWAIAALIWAKEADPQTFRAVYSQYR